MIPSLETERMWAQPEDAEQMQKIFPQREIVKHLGAGSGVAVIVPSEGSYLFNFGQMAQVRF